MKKILVLLLCFNIVLAPTYAFANTSLGGWTITQQIAQGASLALSATKTAIINGATVLKTSTAKITPNASNVAKILRGGAAGYALSIAVEQILGAGIDWVLDPANNAVKYKELGTDPALYQYCWTTVGTCSAAAIAAGTVALTVQGSCQIMENTLKKNYGGYYKKIACYEDATHKAVLEWQYGTNTPTKQTANRVLNPLYDPTAEGEEKFLPLDVVGQRIIDNANAGDVTAQEATTIAAQDMLANDAATQSDVETQLNANAKTQTSEEAAAESTPKDPAAPEAGTNIKITFPVFCSWAPIVCEAAQSAIKFPTTVQNWWNTATQAISSSWLSFKEWLDWTKNDSELPDTETNQVTDLPIPELQENAISWSASCPPDVQVPINLYGQSSTLTFSWSPWCQLLNIIKPAIIASAYIGAAFIVLGLRT